MKKLRNNIPNIVTISRILGTLALLFVPFASKQFYILYIFCGITDVLDGFLARQLKVSSDLGSKLDSISDLVFYFVSFVKLLPELKRTIVPVIWFMLGGIVFIRLLAYGVHFSKTKHLQHSHSILNKLTGFLVFMLPFVLRTGLMNYYYFFALSIAGLGSMEDFLDVFR